MVEVDKKKSINNNDLTIISQNTDIPLKWLLAILLIVLLLGLCYTYLLAGKDKPLRLHEARNLNGAQIAERNYEFLGGLIGTNSQNEPIVYYQICTTVGNPCVSTVSDGVPQSIAWSLLADKGIYSLRHNIIHLNRINSKMDYLLKACNDYNNCWDDVIWGKTESCLVSGFQMFEAYKLTNNPAHLSLISNLVHCSRSTPPVITMMEANLARQLVLLTSLEKTPGRHSNLVYWYPQRLSAAELNRGKNSAVYAEGGFEFRQSDCWIQLAKLEIYVQTNESRYLGDVESFIGSAHLGKNLDSRNSVVTFQDMSSCTELLLNAYDVTGNPIYKDEARVLTSHMVSGYWDSPDTLVFNGDGGFLTMPKYVTPNQKKISDNAYAVYILSRQADTFFTVEVGQAIK